MATPAPQSPQRDLILETAAQAFADRGFPSSSMSELARRCGVSKALLYHYYESKDAILFDLLDRYMRRLLEVCDAVDCQGLPPRERLAALVRAFLAEYRTSQARHMVLVHDVKFLSPGQREIVTGLMRDTVARYRDAVAAAFPGEIAPGQLTPVTMMLFGMMNWTFTWLKPGGAMSYGDYADVVMRLFLEGVPRLGTHSAAPGSGPPPVQRSLPKRQTK
jgi:AcrR family transcriptional regulator